MQKRIPIKNHHQEIQLIAKRSMLALGIIFLLILLLVGRLTILQIWKHDVYKTLATNNWLDLVPIEPTRGLIFDRNGVMLAENVPVFSLDIIPMQVTDLPKTLSALGKLVELSDDDLNQFHRQLKQHRRFDEIPLKLRMSEAELARITENQHRFPGVLIRARLMRHYPFGASFSHVLGYEGRINQQELNEIDPTNYSASHYIGKLGIEKYYEEELHGKVGYEEVENDASGKAIRVLKEIKGTPGKNIYLTLDSGLQLAAEKAMAGHRGAIVAIQPATGQVLAMLSEPGYDPNLFVLGIDQKTFQELQQSVDRPLFDRTLRGMYPMASTIKPYIALQGLNLGMVDTEFELSDPGWFQLRNNSHRYHDWRPHGHGMVNLERAITSSCDTYFWGLGSKLGIHRIDDILTQFGFGAVTGIDLDDELPGLVASPEWKRKNRGAHWYEGDTINATIGQGLMLATPLQMATAVSTLSNRGKRFMPYLLLGEQTPNDNRYTPQQPIPLETVELKDETWDTIIAAMQQVIESQQGTAHRFGKHPSYTIAGKTGTAQIIAKRGNLNEVDKQLDVDERLRDHHLFVAFAPVDHPRIAVAIITENDSTAIETARAMFDYYLGTEDHADRQPQTQNENASVAGR